MLRRILSLSILVFLFGVSVIVAFGYSHNDGSITWLDRKALSPRDDIPVTPVKRDEALDVFSVECLICHDGGIAQQAHYSRDSGHAVRGSHPIGVPLPKSNAFVHPFPGSNIILINGRISCVTCHDMEAPAPHLAVSNAESVLCLSCHRK